MKATCLTENNRSLMSYLQDSEGKKYIIGVILDPVLTIFYSDINTILSLIYTVGQKIKKKSAQKKTREIQ